MSEKIQQPTAEKRPFRWSTIFSWAAVLGIIAISGWGLQNVSDTPPIAGNPAPEFEMQFFNGYEWETTPISSLDDLKGNVVVINFWASWCVECGLEAEELEQAWRTYRDQGVVFVGVAWTDTEPKSLQYLEQYDITYPNAPDLGQDIAQVYELSGVPETFFIDKNGTITFHKIGPIDTLTLDAAIAEALESDG